MFSKKIKIDCFNLKKGNNQKIKGLFYEILKNLVQPWLTAHDCQPSVRFSSQDSQTQLTDSYPSR